ncbi:uncharacterized protein LOC126609129 [Malus sylvestris]|uniref:uncharacterized protein LOC126609129 n=1 Tax=Malus sylvestris TaxID=3752 RepID=UPI0021AC1CCA|nr:uncharacterized protein LOC126609129 [Malus sylvestris]
MEARRRGGSKFPDIDVFSDVYVQPGDELTEPLHATMMKKTQLVLQESISQLPPETHLESVDPPEDAGFQILTETLDQTLGRRPRTYCRGMGNARWREPIASSSSQSKSQVIALTAKVADLRTELALYRSQMSQIVQAFSQSDIRLPNLRPPVDLRAPLTQAWPHLYPFDL